MEKYTEGPWEVGSIDTEYPGLAYNIKCPKGCHVAKVSSRSDKEVKANARLIAAAPELLEALKKMVEWARDMEGSGDAGHWDIEQDEDVKKANAAIAKAEGRK